MKAITHRFACALCAALLLAIAACAQEPVAYDSGESFEAPAQQAVEAPAQQAVEAPAAQAAVVAYPAEYRVTGVMTFLAGPDNLVFEKDLGPNTAEAARAIEQPDSLSSWHRFE